MVLPLVQAIMPREQPGAPIMSYHERMCSVFPGIARTHYDQVGFATAAMHVQPRPDPSSFLRNMTRIVPLKEVRESPRLQMMFPPRC
jgi:hypothetical protein